MIRFSAGTQMEPAKPAAPQGSPELDPLRFRLTRRNGRYYFEKVRYQQSDAGDHGAHAGRIVAFFEGQPLDALTPERLRRDLGDVPSFERLERLIAELHELLVK
ncbi:MAG: hypothetical protein M5U26_25350 [Planctomycetota bacterium]|nr:hypothetical protein [Planctomycetota bacterium]